MKQTCLKWKFAINTQPRSISLPFLPFFTGWIVANFLGGALGGILEARLQFLGTLVLVGSVVGLLQWLFLRRYMKQAAPWAWMMALGWPFANLLRIEISPFFTPQLELLTIREWLWEVFWLNVFQTKPVVLAVIGILQALWLAPRWRMLPSWFLANIAGGAVMGGVGATVCLQYCDRITAVAGSTMTGLVLGALGWVGYAFVTGPVLAFLLRRRSE